MTAAPLAARRSRRLAVDPGQRGFTLTELMVTLAVTTLALAGLLKLHTSMSKSNATNNRQLEASNLADTTLEAFRGLDEDDLVERYDELPIDEDLGEVVGKSATFRRRLVVQRAVDEPMALIGLRVEIGWSDDGAVQGSDGGIHDHTIALELLRPAQGAQ